jgi:peptidoglycan hydrolase-like protein with peptidoglycan-binding domain
VKRPRNAFVVGALVIGLAGCAGGTPNKASTGASTSDAFSTVVAAAGSTTSVVAASGTPTTSPGTATTAPFAPGQAATTVGGPNSTTAKSTTTAASRVVSKPSDNVHLGDTGPGVKQIQTALAALGYKVATDGSFGPQTAQAVKAFQTKSAITADGIVGPVTWAKIQAASTTPASTTTTKAATTTTTH